MSREAGGTGQVHALLLHPTRPDWAPMPSVPAGDQTQAQQDLALEETRVTKTREGGTSADVKWKKSHRSSKEGALG